MSNRLADIAQRKQALTDRADRERTELAAALNKIRSPIDIGATVLGLGRTLKTHPIIAAGISSFLVSGYAGKLLKSTGEVLRLWKLSKPIWDWWRKRRSK
ncbi:MAG: hypothetical protein EXR70_05450 [Deltaproteobacteria bacterium]|nr:hypothetical protein [Deltaproteobacteria bacterium]